MLGKRLIAGFHHCTNSPCWSKSATPKHILGVSLSQLLRQWRSWRTGSAAYGLRWEGFVEMVGFEPGVKE